ncbi:bifunctional [glutamate--ammonia ligase]-adenylyl-L-tyrosine phosphorylase/[glutamate--ammonia-ligase] adenylyltransferase [Parvibium lacunae]|uniref:Bifunctional glutamine synthetase adenylyltransferase/adenylyl-removing enzyme n=1 Tax=Parvibium lacunae TaxID=1888893 RepID=A0A368KZL0_9BURK|nr:bifunctional [glutamate--ammonia ligase]-adenylyl-L-tyrosine phosphorylase/[glutamate--ammonia-ligase] adenylyltransferase [Parvibium lacunae]RCS56750.1 bifunctional [glutamate--ammonia ligase]-adenylyl-L-tyrosine phosphorylase/[glutamate--ammonia-ligase] adenylyltransferase [Parvibium lacunae]
MQFSRITATPSFVVSLYSRYAERVAHFVPEFDWQQPVHVPDRASLTAYFARQWAPAAANADATCEPLAAALRRTRHWAMLHILQADLSGQATLEQVTAALTTLAEFCCQTALQHVCTELAARHGVPCNEQGEAQDLLIIGMGKLGGRELNVSSDIDLIFVYPEPGETRPPATQTSTDATTSGLRLLSNHEYFTRVGQRLIALLSEVTEHGFVFRVDMRLRPYGDAGPLVMSFDMLEQYLVAQGREWERYAWIKARTISAPVWMSAAAHTQQCEQLVQLVTPFVYRKYLDFGAIDAIRNLHTQISAEIGRRETQHAQLSQPGERQMGGNIKLGEGGIRQIEFLAQAFQLIRGGRETSLRLRPTCAVLQACAQRGLIDFSSVTQLIAAYQFLRQVEHRLQYPEDAQTHTLPTHPEAQLALAQSMGYADYAAFIEVLQAHRRFVSQQFAAMFGDKQSPHTPSAAPHDPTLPPTERRLRPRCQGWTEVLQQATQGGSLDPTQAEEMQQRIEQFLQSGRYQSLPDNSKQRCLTLLGSLLAYTVHCETAIPAAPSEINASPSEVAVLADQINISPLQTLLRWLHLLESICRRSAYLALLSEYPQALARVTRMLAAAEWATSYLTRHPILLDELLDDRNLLQPPPWATLERQLRTDLARVTAQAARTQQDPTERHLDLLREFHHAQVFRLLAQDLQGQWTPETLSDQLSALADLILRQTLPHCWAATRQHYRQRQPDLAATLPESPHFAIIAYGKLGGKELGYASDLDLIFLYDDSHPDANEIYAKLAQRLNTWLASQTPAGILFEVDLRLRPNGNAGLLVSSTAAFSRYQREAAWLWEHQALTRARFCAGEPQIGIWFEAERQAVLQLPRNPDTLRQEVLTMRQKMLDGHPNPTALFDLKHDRGGMVDIEFMVQYLVLSYAQREPALRDNVGNIALLQRAAQANLIPLDLALAAADAYRTYRRLQHRLRLAGHEQARVEPARVQAHVDQVKALWQRVLLA